MDGAKEWDVLPTSGLRRPPFLCSRASVRLSSFRGYFGRLADKPGLISQQISKNTREPVHAGQRRNYQKPDLSGRRKTFSNGPITDLRRVVA